MSVGAKIRELRKAKGMTQADLAEELETCSSTISHWEQGRPLSPRTRRRLADVFAVSPGEFVSNREPPRTIADRLRTARHVAGLTQAQVAERSGLSQSQISRWETGIEQPDGGSVPRLAKALGCRPSELSAPDPGSGQSGSETGVGARIRQLRLAKELTQHQLGAKIGTGAQQISHWETERVIPSEASRRKLEKALGAEPGTLTAQRDVEGPRSAASLPPAASPSEKSWSFKLPGGKRATLSWPERMTQPRLDSLAKQLEGLIGFLQAQVEDGGAS